MQFFFLSLFYFIIFSKNLYFSLFSSSYPPDEYWPGDWVLGKSFILLDLVLNPYGIRYVGFGLVLGQIRSVVWFVSQGETVEIDRKNNYLYTYDMYIVYVRDESKKSR